MKKKVCILTTAHNVFDTRIFHKECKSLVRAGFEVTLIAQYDKKKKLVDEIRIVPLPKPKNLIERITLLTTKCLIKALKVNASVYHFHDFELIPIGIILKLFGKKVIYDVHEDNGKRIFSNSYLHRNIRPLAATILKFTQNVFSMFFDYIVVAGDDITENFSHTCKRKLLPIKNVPTGEFLQALNVNRKKLTNTVIYLGALTEGRGIKEIVEAMDYTKNCEKLLLVGPFLPSSFEDEVYAIAGNKVVFIGNISYEKVPGLIMQSKIGIICFHSNPNNLGSMSGRNNKLYEYMAGGLGIIASNFIDWKQIIEGKNVGITVDPKNPKDIASAIDYLLCNDELLQKMGENGVRLVREEYNWNIEKEKLLQIYDKVLKS